MSLRAMFAVAVALVAAAAASSVSEASSTPRADAKPLSGISINVDPGHNPGNRDHPREINRIVERGPIRKACDTTGTSSNSGWAEALFTLDLARRVRTRLVAKGATVTLTHNGTIPAWGPCITKRADLGNKTDLAVSIHGDGNTRTGARGFHVIRPALVRGWTGPIVAPSRDLAIEMRNRLRSLKAIPVSNYAGTDGIAVRGDLGGLTLSTVPKVMIEHGNMRHGGDVRIMRSTWQRDRMANAIVAAIVTWERSHPLN